MVLTLERPSQATQPEPRIATNSVIEPAAVVDHVSKVFIQRPLLRRGETKEVRAVDDVSFTVGHNEIFGILGANGSGKSTLIRMLSTLLIPDSGRVEVFGYDVRRDEAEVKRLINRVSVEASFLRSYLRERTSPTRYASTGGADRRCATRPTPCWSGWGLRATR